jgi:energy-coupling factor transport system permease protein
MMARFLDYTDGTSILHRLNPVTKLGFAVCMCVAGFTSNNLWFLLVLIGIDLLYGALGGVFMRSLGALKALTLMSIVLFVLQPLFLHTGTVLVPLPAGMSITTDGVLLAVKVVLKLIAACLGFALMLYVTRVNDLSNALTKHLGVPYKYAFTTTTAIRFVPVFLNELDGIMEAQTSRGVDFDTHNVFKKFGLILPLCVPLLLSSVKRIDSTAIAAELRGFNLRTRASGYKHYPFDTSDIAALVIGIALVMAAFVVNIIL